MVHYEVPTYTTNDIDKVICINKRECGALTDKALYIFIQKDFALTVSDTVEVLESNGLRSTEVIPEVLCND